MTHLLAPIVINTTNNNISRIISSCREPLWAEAPRSNGEMSLKSLENSLSTRRLRNNNNGSSSSTREDDDSNGNINQQWRSNLARAMVVPPLRFGSHEVIINSIINNRNRGSATGTRRRLAMGVSPEPLDGDNLVPSTTSSPTVSPTSSLSPEPMLWSPFSPEACPCCQSLQHGTETKGSPVWHLSPSCPGGVPDTRLDSVSGPRRGPAGRSPGGSLAVITPLSSRKVPAENVNVAATSSMRSIMQLFHTASGASVVAIDNKIEQAMDLVKSHLMFAVREEVEVLKDQIKELMERNSHLERENSALKGLASPEQLRDIQAQLTGRQQRAIGMAPASLAP